MQMIRLKDVLNEGKSVDGWVLVNGWEKAMDVAKSMGAWSPHMRKKYKTDPVGYTNSDILGKIPKKWADKTWHPYNNKQKSNVSFSVTKFTPIFFPRHM